MKGEHQSRVGPQPTQVWILAPVCTGDVGVSKSENLCQIPYTLHSTPKEGSSQKSFFIRSAGRMNDFMSVGLMPVLVYI